MRVGRLPAGLLALPLIASFGTASGTHAEGRRGDLLRIGIRDDPDLLDLTFSRTCVGTVVMTALCDKLFDFTPNWRSFRFWRAATNVPTARP